MKKKIKIVPALILIIFFLASFQASSEETGLCPSMKNTTPSLFSLQNGDGTLMIFSCPPDAAVLLNSQIVGRTPIKIENVPAGSYTVQLKKEGYLDYLGSATVIQGKKGEMTVFLISATQTIDPNRESSIMNRVFIKTNPSGARIFIDGNEIGITPTEIPNLPVGTHKIQLRREGYLDQEFDIPMTQTNVVTIDAMLFTRVDAFVTTIPPSPPVTTRNPVKGSLNISSSPTGAEVILDGKTIGITPLFIPSLNSGNHNLILKAQGYKDLMKTVEIHDSVLNNLSLRLTPVIRPPPSLITNNSTIAGKIENTRYMSLYSLSQLLLLSDNLTEKNLLLENKHLTSSLEIVKTGLSNAIKQFDSIISANSLQRAEIEQMKYLTSAGIDFSSGLVLLSDSTKKTYESEEKINETGSYEILSEAMQLLRSSEEKISRAKTFLEKIQKPVLIPEGNAALVELRSDIKKSEAVLSSLKKYHLPLQHMLAAQVALHSAQEELSRGNNKNANAGYNRAKEEIQTAQKSMITTFNDPATGPKVKELYAMSQNLMKEIESMLLNP